MARPFLIQGHRGARGLRPENTLPSFEFALDAGVGSIECDAHLTADGFPVLIHDPILGNCINRDPPIPNTAEPLCIHRLTLSQVRDYWADRNPDPQRFPDQSPTAGALTDRLTWDADSYAVPLLADLYVLVGCYTGEAGKCAGKTDAQRANAAKVIIDVEIKHAPFHAEANSAVCVERAVLEVVRKSNAVGRTWIRSFDHRCVHRLRQIEPGLTGVALIEGTAPVDPVALVRAADAQVYAPDYRFLDEEQVRQCHAAGVQVLPWTVNASEDWARLIAWGVDGITTDYPDRLARWLAQPPASAR